MLIICVYTTKIVGHGQYFFAAFRMRVKRVSFSTMTSESPYNGYIKKNWYGWYVGGGWLRNGWPCFTNHSCHCRLSVWKGERSPYFKRIFAVFGQFNTSLSQKILSRLVRKWARQTTNLHHCIEVQGSKTLQNFYQSKRKTVKWNILDHLPPGLPRSGGVQFLDLRFNEFSHIMFESTFALHLVDIA